MRTAVSVYVAAAKPDERFKKMWILMESLPSEKVRLAHTLLRAAVNGVLTAVRLDTPTPPQDSVSVVFAPAHS